MVIPPGIDLMTLVPTLSPGWQAGKTLTIGHPPDSPGCSSFRPNPGEGKTAREFRGRGILEASFARHRLRPLRWRAWLKARVCSGVGSSRTNPPRWCTRGIERGRASRMTGAASLLQADRVGQRGRKPVTPGAQADP